MSFNSALISSLISFCLTVLLLPATLIAAGGGDHATSGSIRDLIPFWFNFLLYIGIVYYLVAAKSRNAYAARRARLIASVNQGAVELKAAREELKIANDRLASVEQEIKKLQIEIAEEGDREAKKILEEAEQRAKRVKSQAVELVRLEERAAQEKLKRELADRITEKAAVLIRSKATADSDRAIREATLNNAKSLIQ